MTPDEYAQRQLILADLQLQRASQALTVQRMVNRMCRNLTLAQGRAVPYPEAELLEPAPTPDGVHVITSLE